MVAEVQRRGLEYEIFKETESSRRTRPVKEEVLARARRGDFNTIIVWKLDRWGRSVRELALELDEFVQRGIQFVSLTDGIDLATPQGRLQAHLLSAFAEFERALLSERTKAGLVRAVAEGKTLGRPRKRGAVIKPPISSQQAVEPPKTDVLSTTMPTEKQLQEWYVIEQERLRLKAELQAQLAALEKKKPES